MSAWAPPGRERDVEYIHSHPSYTNALRFNKAGRKRGAYLFAVRDAYFLPFPFRDDPKPREYRAVREVPLLQNTTNYVNYG